MGFPLTLAERVAEGGVLVCSGCRSQNAGDRTFNNRHSFLAVLELKSKIKAQVDSVSGEGAFRVTAGRLLSASSRAEGAGELAGVPLKRARIPP